MKDRITIKLTGVKHETHDVVTLSFTRPFQFTAGQYISVYFDDLPWPEGKAYSLSSKPSDKHTSITIKNIGGPYSSRLCDMKVGDKLEISQPYGHFNPQTSAPIVGISAGVGISPIWSVLSHELEQGKDNIHLICSNKTPEDIVFRDEITAISDKTKVRHHITRAEVDEDANHKNGRINIGEILTEIPREAKFLLCGSVDFVRSIWRQLVAEGISEKQISTETFFEQ
ncbi:MAG: ferredoxin--NADP reductase [Candidatus Saccharimonadaceae bacterium]